MSAIKADILEKYRNLRNYMERQTIGTEVVIYGASSLMLLLAYVKRKPAYLIRPFRKPAHIPDRLITERVLHTGLIRDVQQRDQDTLVMVSHRPFIPLFASKNRVLPVKLPGVKVNGNGFSWLQNCAIGRTATFLPLTKSEGKDYVVCRLCMVHPPKGHQLLDVSETLLKLRFARFVQDVTGTASGANAKYLKNLQRIETKSISREAWRAWIARHPWLWGRLKDLQASLLPKRKLLPELVR